MIHSHTIIVQYASKSTKCTAWKLIHTSDLVRKKWNYRLLHCLMLKLHLITCESVLQPWMDWTKDLARTGSYYLCVANVEKQNYKLHELNLTIYMYVYCTIYRTLQYKISHDI